MDEPRRRKGRPTVGERVPLGLRVTPEMKKRLDAAAEESGRSQSQEVEFRLERSFERESLLSEALTVAFGRRLAGFLLATGLTISAVMRVKKGVRQLYRDDWTEDGEVLRAAVMATNTLLSALQPPSTGPDPKIGEDTQGVVAAMELINAL